MAEGERVRWALVGVVLAFVAVGCGGGSLTLSEYSEQGSAVVTEMEERIGSLDAELASRTVTVEAAETYWDGRLQARAESLEGLEALDPPFSIAELHDHGLVLFGKLLAAEEALAVRVSSFDTGTDPELWWGTPEADAVHVVDEEILEFCLEFQAGYDATIDRLISADVPWMPGEMKKIVRIDIGCE